MGYNSIERSYERALKMKISTGKSYSRYGFREGHFKPAAAFCDAKVIIFGHAG